MPLLPIDLQTLFTQTPQVGKEQAAQKEAAPLAQSVQGAQLVRKTEQQDNDVNATPEPEEGPERVKNSLRKKEERKRRAPGSAASRGERGSAKGGRGKTGQKLPPPERPPDREVLRDPALGRNVDITS